MARTLEIPDSPTLKVVTLDASTTIEGEKIKEEFEASLPPSLADAVALEGEKEVFRRYINALVIDKQGEKRREIAARYGQGEERKRGKYLSELGIV